MRSPRRYIHRMNLEMDADLFDQVEEKAISEGKSVSAYIREALVEKINKAKYTSE